MPSKNDAHVSGNRSDGYKVTVGGKTVTRVETQTEAAQIGRNIAQQNKSELFVHRAQGEGRGQIRERDRFGNDPFPRSNDQRRPAKAAATGR